jgi:hypothetical protein
MKTITINQGEYTLEEITKLFEENRILKYPNGAVVEALENTQRYFFFGDHSGVCFDSYYNTGEIERGLSESDKHRLLTRNVFLIKEEAEKELKRTVRYYEIINEIDKINREENWVADWNDGNQGKRYLSYDYTDNRFISETSFGYRKNVTYMCKKAADWALTLPDEDKKILIGIYE